MSFEQTYENEMTQYRAERETRLRDNDRSWLALAGLFWLVEGNNTFGKATTNDIQLEATGLPDQAGVFQYRNGSISIRAADNATITCKGEAVKFKTLRFDIEESPLLETGEEVARF